ncbi:nuclease domain-containing protein [Marinobacter salarius]|uniref:nuclease domain-containing protein n=1 Tax=Marinobacter salarius TaxID=1420917 RepID=UPI003D0F642A
MSRKTSKMRQAAQGEACTLQIHPYCNGDLETTVLCHLPSQYHGMGLKSPDWWAVFGCSSCHDILDERNPVAIRDLGRTEIHLCIMRALYRTQVRFMELGNIKVTGAYQA